MLKTFALIAYIAAGSTGGPVSVPEYTSEAACSEAGDQLVKHFKEQSVEVKFSCIPGPDARPWPVQR